MDRYFRFRRMLAATLILTALVSQAGVREITGVRVQLDAASGLAGNERLYIVQLEEPPALALFDASSESNVKAANLGERKRRLERFDPDAPRINKYVSRLRSRQAELLRTVRAEHKQVYSYRYTFNGVAVKLSSEEADKLRLQKGVKGVWEDRRRKVTTNYSPSFLGLFDKPGGLRSDLELRGEDVIIGVIDSGISPGHPSFSHREQIDRRTPRLCRGSFGDTILGFFLCRKYRKPLPIVYSPPPPDWNGICQTGEDFDANDCNNKLIGARFYRDGFDLLDTADVNEFDSPADADGHGTHVASIAAGNLVEAEVFGRDVGRISGIAPRARIAVYKACWLPQGATRAVCSIADTQKAIEDAVADGVDVIHYAIGSIDNSLTDPDDLALLAAADAGILAVTPTGNDGPNPGSIDSPATTPWVISVGASTRSGNRTAEGLRVNKPEAVAGDYESKEAAFTPKLADNGPVTGNLVLADDGEIVTPEGQAGTVFDACDLLINGDEVSGGIAFVQRGGCDFDVKLENVQAAGAIAMVVFNNDAGVVLMSGDSAVATVPAVMIGQADGQLLRDRILDDEAVEITLDKSIFIRFAETGSIMGSFSGRGPSFGDPDFLKPDVVAPGVNILAGQAPKVANGFRGEKFQYLTGTSQAVPHVTGLAALLKEAKPDWTPAEIKSAIMTSARQDVKKEDGSTQADAFDMGAGHIVPNNSVNPGLLFDITTDEFDSYLCTVGLERITAEQCQALIDGGLSLDARDLNLPSIAITELASTATVTRRVRNPGEPAQFSANVQAQAGLDVTVTPDNLSLGTDETAEYTVRFDSDGSELYAWQSGDIMWSSETSSVYTPFAVQPVEFSATNAIISTGATGSAAVNVNFGYTGTYSAVPVGLELPCVLPDNTPDDSICTNTTTAVVADDPANSYEFEDTPTANVARFTVEVSPDSPTDVNTILRIAMFDELTDGNDDLDLYLFRCIDIDADHVCESVYTEDDWKSQRDESSNELITVFYPEPGDYIIDVHGYNTDGASANFNVYVWALDSGSDAGNLSLSDVPAGAEAGTSAMITVDWAGLAEGLWLGGISHNDSTDRSLDVTVIEIANNAFPPPAP